MVRGTLFLAVSPVMRLKLSVRRPVDRLGNAFFVGIVAVGDTTKAKLVRSTPETFKGLGLSQQSASCPPKGVACWYRLFNCHLS